MQPIWIVQSGSDPIHDLCGEILRCEGFPWFETHAAEMMEDVPPHVRLIVATGTSFDRCSADRLARCVSLGTPAVVLAPDRELLRALDLMPKTRVSDGSLGVRRLDDWEHDDIRLLCHGDTTCTLSGGVEVAGLWDYGGVYVGPGLIRTEEGRGEAWAYGYDLCRTIALLRHGTGELDEPDDQGMGPLTGPRHIYGFRDLSMRLPRDIPVADLHQDILRSLVRKALGNSLIPRIWHFPEAAPSLWFIKGDGCGEAGADVEVAVAEASDAYLSFYRAPESRYDGDLMREWHARGHGISLESNLDDITRPEVDQNGSRSRVGRTTRDLDAHALPEIRDLLESHRDRFERETHLETDTVCIHGCQWTGSSMARILLDLGWHTPTHFISHDPRMQYGECYGPYMISTGLPMRYYDATGGVLDLWHLPAQWDESQTIGRYGELVAGPAPGWSGYDLYPESREFFGALAPDRAEGMVGLTAEEYGTVLGRFAEDAARRWHGVQIANFHPVYVAIPQDHPRASRIALELGMEGARAAGCRFENLERWSRFFRARADIRLVNGSALDDTGLVRILSDEGVAGLTLLLSECTGDVWHEETGDRMAIREVELEGRLQRAVVMNLKAGELLSLRMSRRDRE